MKNSLFNIIFLLLLFVECRSDDSGEKSISVNRNISDTSLDASGDNHLVTIFNYDLKKPKRTWKLPSSLVEVSGNTWVDKDHLLLIEDRIPDLYLVKISDKNVNLVKRIPFQNDKKGKFDIEDVTIVNNVVYALWSHGILFRIANWDSKPDVKEIPTFLSKENNTEGLCYDPVTKNLLIACKDSPGIKAGDKSTKAVYQFDTVTEKLKKNPFLIIDKRKFEKLVGREIEFYPSAVAVHPITHNIYLLSTRENKCMAIFNREGVLISFQFIDENLMPQPEGICFSPEGVMYISTEGKDGRGKLLEFERK